MWRKKAALRRMCVTRLFADCWRPCSRYRSVERSQHQDKFASYLNSSIKYNVHMVHPGYGVPTFYCSWPCMLRWCRNSILPPSQ